MSENKLQWSKFIGPDRSEQVVVRSDDPAEFEELKSYVETMFASSSKNDPRVHVEDLPTYPEVNQTNPYEETPDQEHVCKTHHKQMKERINKRTGGVFYDHRMKNEAGVWLMCNGDGTWRDSAF